MAQLKVELVRGLMNLTAAQLGSVKGLGLRKRHQVIIIEDTPSVRGMINKVSHLVRVEELEG